MRKLLGTILALALLCSAVLLVTGCNKSGGGDNVSDSSISSNISDESIDVAKTSNKFTKDDAVVTVKGHGDISLGMTRDEVRAVIGEPKDIEQDDILGEMWYYGDGFCDVDFNDDVVDSIYISALSDETVSLKTTGLHVESTFDEVISTFYDNGKKEKIDFVSEIKRLDLGDYLIKEYEGVDAYYLYGNLFDDSVLSCGYVMHTPSDGVMDEYDSIMYNYFDFDEGSDSAGYNYTITFDTYTDDDGTSRIGDIHIRYERIGE